MVRRWLCLVLALVTLSLSPFTSASSHTIEIGVADHVLQLCVSFRQSRDGGISHDLNQQKHEEHHRGQSQQADGFRDGHSGRDVSRRMRRMSRWLVTGNIVVGASYTDGLGSALLLPPWESFSIL